MNRKFTAAQWLRFFLALALLAVLIALRYTGFCFEQLRYIPDQENIDTVVLHTLKRYPPTLQFDEQQETNGEVTFRQYALRPEQPIGYTDLADFYARNPGCCEVTIQGGEGTNDTPPAFQRLCGLVAGYVRVRYALDYRENGERKRRTVDERTAISHCGELFND